MAEDMHSGDTFIAGSALITPLLSGEEITEVIQNKKLYTLSITT